MRTPPPPAAPRGPADRRGFALITTLLVTSAVGVMIAGSLLLAISNQRIARNDASSARALAAAQAGSAYWRAELVSLYAYMLDNWELYQDDVEEFVRNGGTISCGNYFAIGVDADRDGEPDIGDGEALPSVAVPMTLADDGTVVQSAETRAVFSTVGSTIRLDVRAAGADARARVVDEFSITSVDIWNNAVFAQTSAANARIQGRATIRGAVHILGENLPADEIALDLTGSFGLGNTYRGLSNSLDVEELNLTVPDPDDLCATLRVRSGRVVMEGSANLGFPDDDPTDEVKHYLRGIYANDNIEGGVLEDNVFSENGMSAAYDSGDSFTFPDLDDVRPDTGRSWRQELHRNSLWISTAAADGDRDQDDRNTLPLRNADGSFALPAGVSAPGTGDFYLSAGCVGPLFGILPDGTRATQVRGNNRGGNAAAGFALDGGATADFSCTKYRVTGGSANPTLDEVVTHVEWNLLRQRLTIGGTAGVVRMHGGNLLITGDSGGSSRLGYRGDGILFVEDADPDPSVEEGGDVTLEIDFLPTSDAPVCQDERGMPLENECPAGIANTYPATALLGLVADGTVRSSGAQQRFTVAMYAEDSVLVEKQTLIAGGIVTRTFDAGSQVPTVLYVPNLAERLSDLMPGAGGAGYAISNVAFSRR